MRRKVMVFLSLWLAVASVWTFWDYVQFSDWQEKIEEGSKNRARVQVTKAVEEIGEIVKEVERAATKLADDISNDKTFPDGLETRLKEISDVYPRIFGLGAAVDPQVVRDSFCDAHQGKTKPPKKPCTSEAFLYAPYFRRTGDASKTRELVFVNDTYDYTSQTKYWYICPLGLYPDKCPKASRQSGGMWLEPYFGEASQRMVEEFAVPFYRPGGREQGEEPIGVAWANMSLHELSGFLASLDIGAMGYSFLLSPEGAFIAHPRESKTDRSLTIQDAADEIEWPELVQYFERARDAENGMTPRIEKIDPLSGEDAWWFFRGVPLAEQADWVLGIVVLKDELMERSQDDRRRRQIRLTLSGLGLLLPAVLLLIAFLSRDIDRSLWWGSISVSIGLLVTIGIIWSLALRYPHFAGTAASELRRNPPSSECELRLKAASGDDTQPELIRRFKTEFKSKKKECGVLIVRAAGDSEQLTIAGFNDAGQFRTVEIDDPTHGLSKELKKEPKDDSRIVELARSSLGTIGAPKILSQAQLDRFKKRYADYLSEGRDLHERDAVFLPTGLFVQSLQFVESNAVRVTGYIWQQLSPTDSACEYSEGQEPPDLSFRVKGTSDECTTVVAGVLFPEATAENLTETYRQPRSDGGLTIGWDFDVTLREIFGYTNYPFDVENVWLRLWHKQIGSNVVLVPDIRAYPFLSPTTLPGLEKDLVLPDWDLESAYFGYRNHSYSTDFGLKNYLGEENFPELYFNILVKRRFLGPFISSVMPVLVVAAILFALVLTITRKDESTIIGFNTSAVLASTAGLFFGVLIGHTELRSSLHATGLVYIETFYLIMYAALLLMAVNTYVFSVIERVRVLQWRDNLLPKLLYWPSLLLAVLAVTLTNFY